MALPAQVKTFTDRLQVGRYTVQFRFIINKNVDLTDHDNISKMQERVRDSAPHYLTLNYTNGALCILLPLANGAGEVEITGAWWKINY